MEKYQNRKTRGISKPFKKQENSVVIRRLDFSGWGWGWDNSELLDSCLGKLFCAAFPGVILAFFRELAEENTYSA